jgi:hypothetical protein
MAWSWQDTSPNNQVSENIQIQICKYSTGLLFGLKIFKNKYANILLVYWLVWTYSNTNM